MRISAHTEQEMSLHMSSFYQIERDISRIYWSYGMFQQTHRIEWWAILDSDSKYRFYEFSISRNPHEVKCTQTFASSKTKEIENYMKRNARMAYVLFLHQTR